MFIKIYALHLFYLNSLFAQKVIYAKCPFLWFRFNEWFDYNTELNGTKLAAPLYLILSAIYYFCLARYFSTSLQWCVIRNIQKQFDFLCLNTTFRNVILRSQTFWIMISFLNTLESLFNRHHLMQLILKCFETHHRVIIMISNYLSFSKKINTFFDCNQKSNKNLTFITHYL